MRPINNIVDITNYVMMEYGQPMHAFDFSCVEDGEITSAAPARRDHPDPGRHCPRADENMLCICDTEKPVGVAGVMGGANSEIVGDTAMVLFESANFDGTSIRRTATALGMRTDASARYEKGLDPANTMLAVNRACELVELLGAGEVVDGVIDVYPGPLPQTTVKLEPDKVNALLGTDIDRETMVKILTEAGLHPGRRHHIRSLLARRRGALLRHRRGGRPHIRLQQHPQQILRRQHPLRRLFRSAEGGAPAGRPVPQPGHGRDNHLLLHQPHLLRQDPPPGRLPPAGQLKILNPLGEDTSIMRTTVLPSMLEILTRNYNFRNKPPSCTSWAGSTSSGRRSGRRAGR
jgi:phenylalanyl-tRNA synthetase beta chain